MLIAEQFNILISSPGVPIPKGDTINPILQSSALQFVTVQFLALSTIVKPHAPPLTTTLSRVLITDNIFEANMTSVANHTTYNTNTSLIEIENAHGALIANNIFTLQGTSTSYPQINIKNSQYIKFLNNTIQTGVGNNQIGIDNSCSNITIAGNTFRNCASGYTAVALNGTNNHVKDNIFSGAGQKITASGSNNYVLNNIALDSTSSTFVSGSVAVKKGNYNNSGSEL